MTAKEKFEARVDELGLDWNSINNGGFDGVETDKEIIVLVHYDHNDRFYSEYHYSRFDSMTRGQIDTLTAHFASEYNWEDGGTNREFVTKLALWCAGAGSCPLFPCDVYTNIDPIEEIEFKDDEPEGDEEVQYQIQLENNKAQIALIRQFQKLHKKQLVEMIRMEHSRGHNLFSDFDPYPGWGSYYLCGYSIENHTMVVEEMNDGTMVLALYQEGWDTVRLPLTADDFPIAVLMEIYASMK